MPRITPSSRRVSVALCAAAGLGLLVGAARAQSPAFTYQGLLRSGDNPANGPHDLPFTLFDAAAGPAARGWPRIRPRRRSA